jgi:type III restriction enzyme
VRLEDQRILVVEWKGAHIASSLREQDKRRVGELWADRSGGACLFAFPTNKDELDVYLASTGLH